MDKLSKLLDSGSIISREKLRVLRNFLLSKKNIFNNLDDVMEELASITYDFLKSGVIDNINSNIVTNNISLNIYSGIKYDTEYDIASVTKLFTLILVLNYIDNKVFNLNDKICDIDSNFKYLDYTILDLIKMSGLIITDKRIDEANDYKEGLNRLYSVYPINYDKTVNNYTDIGFMVLSKLVENINGKSFNDIMIDFYRKYGIRINQMNNIIGHGYNDCLPHDPKARIMNGMIGSAGIFINSFNMNKFAFELFNYDLISKDNLYALSNKLFEYNHDNKGIAGIYIKHPLGICKTSTPNEYSKYAFSHQGYTGSCAIFDPLLKIHNSILVDAIKDNNKKDINFYKYFNIYHQKLVMITLKAYLINSKEKIKMINRL